MADTQDFVVQMSSSQLSIGFPERSNSSLNKIPFGPYAGPLSSDKNLPVTDQCCIGLYCSQHEKLLTARLKNKGLYLPNFVIRSTDSWYEISARSIQHLLETQHLDANDIQLTERLVDIMRVQLPKQYPHYLTRVTFVVILGPHQQQCQSQPDDLYLWMSLENLKQNETLWGVEPLEIFNLVKEYSNKMNDDVTATLPIVFREFDQRDAHQHLLTMNPNEQKEKELLLSAKFTLEEVQKLFNEFVMQCFPSQFMTYSSFKIFMNKVGWVNDEEILYKMVFRSFTSSANETKWFPYLTFDEFIVGLAAMEERADHRGNCLKLRLRYIFHFYDSCQSGQLTANELSQMMIDIKKRPNTDSVEMIHQNSTKNPAEIDSVVAEMFRRIVDLQATSTAFITYEKFIECADNERNSSWIADLTETLFRSNISTIDVASIKFDYKIELDQINILKVQTAIDRYEESCEMCHFVKFNICSHGIKIDERGLLLGTLKFDLSPFYQDTPFLQEMNIGVNEFNTVFSELRRISMLAINTSTSLSSNENLNSLRQLKNKEVVLNIKEILKLSKEIIQKEPKIVKFSSPCFIISEIWSNISSLHALISLITRMVAPFVTPVNIIFLGNYFDPNSTLGIETLIYLLCFKILMPKRVLMLRGSNETRASQANSKANFFLECGDFFGPDTLEIFYEIFESLPIASVVDERLFLSKSGIPLKNQKIWKIFDSKSSKSDAEVNSILFGKPRTTDSSSKQIGMKKIVQKKIKNNKEGKVKKNVRGSMNRSSSKQKENIPIKKKIKQQNSVIRTNKKKSKATDSTGTSSSNSSFNSIESNISFLQQNIDFTPKDLKNFLKRNNFSHFIRSEPPPSTTQSSKSFRISFRGSMLSLTGIGQPLINQKLNNSNSNITSNQRNKYQTIVKTNGTIALANRNKIRVLRFEKS